MTIEMDTCQILNAVRQDELMYEHFLGVFPRDMIPKQSGDSCLIANTDTSKEEGTHWVAMFKQDNICEFFDSYGRKPFKNKFLSINSSYNSVKLQSNYSTVCGEYCIYYLYHRSRDYGLREIVFSLQQNGDNIVKDFYEQNFDKCRKGSGLSCKCIEDCQKPI